MGGEMSGEEKIVPSGMSVGILDSISSYRLHYMLPSSEQFRSPLQVDVATANKLSEMWLH